MPKKNDLSAELAASPEFQNLIKLLAIVSEATARNLELQAEINKEHLTLVDDHKDDYAQNQAAITLAESGIETIVERNPGWFEKKKTLTTPYGVIKVTSGNKLSIPSEGATLRLIHAAGLSAAYIRTTEEVDKEAIEKLSDEQLAEFAIIREKTSSIKITPISVDLGKAPKEAAAA